jgi:hypothetical protein
MGILHFFTQLGQLIFTRFAIILVESYGAKSPFTYIACADALCVLLGVILACSGKIKS